MANVPYQPDDEPVPVKLFIGIFLCLLAVALIVTACRETVIITIEDCDDGNSPAVGLVIDGCTLASMDLDELSIGPNGGDEIVIDKFINSDTGEYAISCLALGEEMRMSASADGYVSYDSAPFIAKAAQFVPMYPIGGCDQNPDMTPFNLLQGCIQQAAEIVGLFTAASDCCELLRPDYPDELDQVCTQ